MSSFSTLSAVHLLSAFLSKQDNTIFYNGPEIEFDILLFFGNSPTNNKCNTIPHAHISEANGLYGYLINNSGAI